MEPRTPISSINPVFFSIFGFTAGVFLSSFVFVSPLISVLIIAVTVSILLAEKIQNERIMSEVLVLSVLLISLSLGSLRYEVKDFHELKTPSEAGVVVSEPEDKENTKRFVFLSDSGEKVLVFDLSFQLSFLATLGLIYVMPIMENFLKFVTEKWQLRGILAQTMATQATVLPLLMYSVGDVSLVSLPANILILLIVPWTMLVGFVAVVLSYVSGIMAWPVALVTHLMLTWILFVSHTLGSFSFATLKIPPLFFWVVFLIYLLVPLFIAKPWRNFPRFSASSN